MRQLLIFVCFLFFVPQNAYAKRGYTKSQVESIIKKACKKKISDTLKKDKWLRDYDKKQRDWKKHGYCEMVTITEKVTKCNRKCRHLIRRRRNKCLKKRKCKTTTRRKRVKICAVRDKSGKIVYRFDGKKKKRRLRDKFKSFTKKVGKGFKKAAGKMKELAKKAAKKTKEITDKVRKKFRLAIEAFRRKIKKIAKKLANASEMKQRLAGRIGAVMLTKALAAKSMGQGKFRAELLKTLKSSRNLNVVKRTQAVKQNALRTTKAFGKTAMLSIGIAVAFSSATVAVECWAFSGSKKRGCLSRSINKQLRVLSFNVLAALVQTAVDLKIIEPTSHSLAAAVSAAAAAATFGIGAAAYPLAYLASSLSLNAVMAVLLEKVVRSKYDSVYNRKLASSAASFVSSLLGRIPTSSLKCHGPKQVCRN